MKKVLSVLVALSGLLAAGCVDNEIIDVNTKASDHIGFSATTTRAGVSDLDVMQRDATGFRVYATSGDAPTGWYSDGAGCIDGTNHHRWDGSKWRFTQQVKWPEAGGYPMNFYALYPADPAGLGAVNEGFSPVTLRAPYTVQPAAAQVDLLTAKAGADHKPISSSLQMTFRHILSKIGFGITTGEGVDVQVQSIDVVNVGETRTYDFVTGQWTGDVTGSASYRYYPGAQNNHLMLMPQSSASWIPAPTASSGGYVSVIYRMSTGNGTTGNGDPREVGFADAAQYPGGSGAVSGPLYVKAGFPLAGSDFSWDAGRSYTYNIGLGTLGSCNGYILDEYYYDESGNLTSLKLVEVLNEGKSVGDKLQAGTIRVTLTVDDWDESTGNIETPKVTVTPNTHTFPQGGDTQVFTVSTNALWWSVLSSSLPTGYILEEDIPNNKVTVIAPANGSIHTSGGSFTVEASNGPTATVILNQEALEPDLKVTPKSYTFPQGGGTQPFTVESNADSWRVLTSTLPLGYTLATSGTDTSGGTVTVKAPANDSFDPLEKENYSFTVMTSHGKTEQVAIGQEAMERIPTITVVPPSFMFPATSSEKNTFKRFASVTLENIPGGSWSLSHNGLPNYFQIQKVGDNIWVLADDNNTGSEINGAITVTAKDAGGTIVKTVDVPVTQEATAVNPTLSVTPGRQAFQQGGGEKVFSVVTNATSWSITHTLPGSYTVEPKTQFGTITVTAPPNTSPLAINGTITVTTSHSPALTQTVSVSQEGKLVTPTLTVDPMAWTFPPNGDTKQFTVGSNATSWSIGARSLPAGYNLTTSGTGASGGTVTVTAPPNGTTSTLSGYFFTVIANGLARQVSISQSPQSPPKNFTVSPAHLTFAQGGGSLPVFAQSSSSLAGLSGVHTANNGYTPYTVGAASLTNGDLYGTMYVNAQPNSSLGTRYGKVTVSAPGYNSRTVTTSQSGVWAWDQAQVIYDYASNHVEIKISNQGPIMVDIYLDNMYLMSGDHKVNATLEHLLGFTGAVPLAGKNVTLKVTWTVPNGETAGTFSDTISVGALTPGTRNFTWSQFHKW